MTGCCTRQQKRASLQVSHQGIFCSPAHTGRSDRLYAKNRAYPRLAKKSRRTDSMRTTIPKTSLKFAVSATKARVILSVALVFLLASPALQRLVRAASGDLDSTFGTGGKVSLPLPGSNDSVRGTAIQSDGKIVVAGSDSNDFTLARYNTNGTLDSSFGSAGEVVTDFSGGADQAFAVAIDSSGKIVVAGSAANPSTVNPTGTDFALARYNTNGSLDMTFGSGGKVVTDFNGGPDQASALIIDSNGKIVVGGRAFNKGSV